MVPVIGADISQNIPESLKEKLAQKHTVIKPIDKQFSAKNGHLYLNDMDIETDLINIESDTRVALSGQIEGKGLVRFKEELSAALLAGVEQLKYLADDNNAVEFPLSYSLRSGKFTVAPDMDYITQKLVKEKGAQILQDLIKEATGAKEKQQPAKPQTQGGQESSPEDALGDFLKGIMDQPE
jgi:hypothetical protein